MTLQRLRAAGLVAPVALALPALALLIGLGTWQMQRKAWKEDLIAQITARIHQPPVAFAELEKQAASGSVEYARARAHGTFRHDGEQFLWEPDPRQGPGYHVYTPLRLDDGRFILVNRGYVTEAKKAPSSRPEGQIRDEVEVVGLLREPIARPMFSPDHDTRTGVWYWRDLDGMTKAALGVDTGKAVRYVLDAEATPANPGGWPQGGVTRLTLPNRHLEYAVTWYGLALTLIGVLTAFIISRWRAAA
ncbi:MAG: SURF1 family protein [Hyphomicrobiaceae bacterium]